jgi:hypothetical protein
MMDEVAVCVKQKCKCGQEWEQTMLMRKDEKFHLDLSSPSPDWHAFYQYIISNKELPPPSSVQLLLVGHVELVSVQGMNASGGPIRCSKCGEDLMYMGRGDIEGIGNVYPKKQDQGVQQ